MDATGSTPGPQGYVPQPQPAVPAQPAAVPSAGLPGYRPAAPQPAAAVPQPPQGTPREPAMDDLLSYVVDHEASDLHLVVGRPPLARIAGELMGIPGYAPLTAAQATGLVTALMSEQERKKLDQDREADFSYGFGGKARFRVNAFHQKGVLSAACRLIPMEPIPLEDLDLPEVVRTFASLRDGLVLITGPTGAGKSTTLAALIDKVNRERKLNIITVEDPIEFYHRHKVATVQQREVESDTPSFARALKSILRQDPDVILVGEMRDLETIAAAVTAAETGHLVFATLHTNSASSAVDRIVDVFPANQQGQVRSQLAASLRAVVSQRLVASAHGGRCCVAEVLINTPAVANLIREGKTHQLLTAMQTAKGNGMVHFDGALAAAVKQGKVPYAAAEPLAADLQEFKRLVGGRVI